MTVYHEVYLLAFIMNVVTALVVIFLERRNVVATLAWLTVLLFFPIVGFLLYLVFGRSMSRRKLYKLRPEQEAFIQKMVSEQTIVLKHDHPFEYRDPSVQKYRRMIAMNLVASHAYFTQDNDVEVFTEGIQKFESLFGAIEQAKQSVHLEYYIVKDDGLGKRLRDLLVRKAEEAVQVRILYDAVGSVDLPRDFFQPLIAAGGHACAFFRAKIPFVNLRLNNRNHRKLAIIDGNIGYVGGFNVGDEYLGLDPRFGPWRDTHLKIVGNAVIQLQALFLMDWNVASADKVFEDMRHYPQANGQGNVGIQIVSSGPDSPSEQIRNNYITMIHAAERCVFIQTPYFIPDESLLTALVTAALSGVDVRIMIPAVPDHPLVYWASMYYVGEMLAVGVKFYLYERGFLHAKTVLVDGMVASVGTANLDIRSFKLNFEVNAILYDTTTVKFLQDIFRNDLSVCKVLTLEEYHRRPRLHRLREPLARLLSPIL